MNLSIFTLRRAVINQLRNKCHKNLACSSWPGNICPLTTVQMRPIYSDSFIHLDTLKSYLKRQKAKAVPNKGRVETSLRTAVEDQNTKSLFFHDDLTTFNLVVENRDDLNLWREVLKVAIAEINEDANQQPRRDPALVNNQVINYFRRCISIDQLEAAALLWENPAYQKQWGHQLCKANLIYFVFLYRRQKYKELIDAILPIMNESDKLAKVFNAERRIYDTLALAALVKMNDAANSLPIGRTIYQKAIAAGFQGRNRSTLLLSLMAYQCGENAEAYDLLTFQGAPTNNMWYNLRLAVLTASDRGEEALQLLGEDFLKNSRKSRKVLCYDVMNKLVDVVGKDQEQKADFTRICKELDSKASLVETSLEDLILSPIHEKRSAK